MIHPTGKLISGLIALSLIAPAFAADNLLSNGSFENSDQFFDFGDVQGYEGWLNLGGMSAIVEPPSGAKDGTFALRLSNFVPGNGIVFAIAGNFTPDGWVQGFPVESGQEVYAYASILADVPVVGDDTNSNRMMKIAFFDANGVDISPTTVSKGIPDIGDGVCYQFPGVIASPKRTAESTPGAWQLAKAQAVAADEQNQLVATCQPDENGDLAEVVNVPPGATSVGLFLFNINFTGEGADVYFDDVFLGILQTDDDSDRIENGIDSDPINVSADFNDGTTSGSIAADADGILEIFDAPEAIDGVRIVSDPGNAAPARVRVCDSSATLSIRPNSDVIATCGSVILAVAPDSEPVVMEIEFDGEAATIEVPPEVTLTYEPEDDSIAVKSSSTDPEPVILTVGDTTVPVYPTSVPGFPVAIDVKPGSNSNCVNINGNGVIPVAILGSDLVDVSTVDLDSLAFGGLNVTVRGSDNPSCGMEDTNLDGFVDLVCLFEDDPALWSIGSSSAALSGELYDGTVITGSDSICVVP